MKNIRISNLKVFIFWVVKFSIYLNRRIFVMNSSEHGGAENFLNGTHALIGFSNALKKCLFSSISI